MYGCSANPLMPARTAAALDQRIAPDAASTRPAPRRKRTRRPSQAGSSSAVCRDAHARRSRSVLSVTIVRSSFCTLKWHGSAVCHTSETRGIVRLENHRVQLALLVNLAAAVVEARVEAEEHLRQHETAGRRRASDGGAPRARRRAGTPAPAGPAARTGRTDRRSRPAAAAAAAFIHCRRTCPQSRRAAASGSRSAPKPAGRGRSLPRR